MSSIQGRRKLTRGKKKDREGVFEAAAVKREGGGRVKSPA